MSLQTSIAIWDDELLNPVASAFEASSYFEVIRTSVARCEQLALAGMTDVALMPAISVFLHEDDVDVYSRAAVSSWRFPFARLVMNVRLGETLERVEYAARDRNFAVIARIVMNEHYQQMPQFIESDQPHIKGQAGGIIATDSESEGPGEKLTLDLGQEWYELSGYPMVWGLFVSHKGSLLKRTDDKIRDVMAVLKTKKDTGQLQYSSKAFEDFYSNNLRLGYDDLVTASLTELSQYLFYYNVIDQPVTVPVITPEEEA